MKLKELLKVIPDNYIIGLMDADVDEYDTLVFGRTKNDVIWSFGQRERMNHEQVLNMNVEAIHPGATAYLPDRTDMYGDDSVELHVKTQILIEVSQ